MEITEQEYNFMRSKIVEKYRYNYFDDIFNLSEDLKDYCIRNGLDMLSGYNTFDDLCNMIEDNTMLVDNLLKYKLEQESDYMNSTERNDEDYESW